MNFRIKVIFIYCTVTVLSLGLCWNIYLSTHKINDAFTTFTNEDLQILDHLFSFRVNLDEYEQLLYEYYATTSRTPPVLVKLTLVRRTLDEDLVFLARDSSTLMHSTKPLI